MIEKLLNAIYEGVPKKRLTGKINCYHMFYQKLSTFLDKLIVMF